MNEFSPGQLGTNDIQFLLRLISDGSPAREDVAERIKLNAPKIHETAKKNATQGRQRALNVLIGARQCGLLTNINPNVDLSDIGKSILSAATAKQASDQFAKHLIENCHGAQLFDIVQMIRARGLPVTGNAIRDELANRGYEVTENEGNASKIRLWIEPSGVVDGSWQIDEVKLNELVGLSSSTLAQWLSMSRARRVFLEQVKRTSPGPTIEWLPVRGIKAACEAHYGRHIFPTGRLRDQVISPLVDGGWLEARGTGSGRGGDSGQVKACSKLLDVSIRLPVEDIGRIPSDLRPLLSTPLAEILVDLNSTDTDVKGRALELLALNIVRDLGLTPVGFRVRSTKTSGAEVDLIAESASLLFSRWLIQCKNTPASSLSVDQIAKEVGMATILNAHVLVLVTTGSVGRVVRQFANGIARTTSLQTIFIDREVIERYSASSGSKLIDIVQRSARETMMMKQEQRSEVL